MKQITLLATLGLFNLADAQCTTKNPIFSQDYYTEWKKLVTSKTDLITLLDNLQNTQGTSTTQNIPQYCTKKQIISESCCTQDNWKTLKQYHQSLKLENVGTKSYNFLNKFKTLVSQNCLKQKYKNYKKPKERKGVQDETVTDQENAAIQKSGKGIIGLIKKNLGFVRVLECAICMGSQDHSKILSDGKINYNSDSLQKFKTNLASSLNAINQGDQALKQQAEKKIDDAVDQSKNGCSGKKEKVKKQIPTDSSGKCTSETDCKSKIQDNISFMNPSKLASLGNLGQDDSRILAYRVLQSKFYTTSSNGIAMEQQDSDDPTQYNGIQQDQSHSSMMYLTALVMLFAFI